MAKGMRLTGKEPMMNRAEGSIHKTKGEKRERPHTAGPGRTSPADMRGAQEGSPTDHNPLTHAVKELHEQHPIRHDDHGPHHGHDHHVRHEPLHGMKPR